jgi:hypothetical protein
MFSRKSKAERTAGQAWEYLSSAMAAAGDTAREYTAGVANDLVEQAGKQSKKARKKSSKLANKATKKASRTGNRLAGQASGKAGEAWTRANRAADALAGRNQGRPWGTILGFSLIGVGLGWAAATAGRAALERQSAAEERELADTATIVTPR